MARTIESLEASDDLRREVATLRRRLAAAERVAEAADVFVDSSPYGQHYNRERQALIGSLAAWRKERG